MSIRGTKHFTGRVASILLMLFCFGTNAALAQCPEPDSGYPCEYWPPLLGYGEAELITFCEGPACFDKSYGDEVTAVAADDSIFPDLFTLRHSGEIINVSCGEVETKALPSVEKTKIWMSAARHCMVEQHTVGHLYLHFFASNPAHRPGCLTWVQCKVY